jgi:nickel/cobalt exporter
VIDTFTPVVALLGRFDDRGLHELLVGLIDDASRDPLVQALALATALLAGALHAAGPGHGKTMMAGYLASSRGRHRDAVALGVLVAAMHTGSVLVLALLFHTTGQAAVGPTLDAILSIVSALAITAVGVVLVRRQLQRRRARRVATSRPAVVVAGAPADGIGAADHHAVDVSAGGSGHEHHDGHHDHHHDLPDTVAPLSSAGILALATSGGLLPSPAAFAVLVTAIATGRGSYGLALLVAFSAGLALALAGLGVVIVAGRERLARHAVQHRALSVAARTVPMAGALVVLAGGLAMIGLNAARL